MHLPCRPIPHAFALFWQLLAEAWMQHLAISPIQLALLERQNMEMYGFQRKELAVKWSKGRFLMSMSQAGELTVSCCYKTAPLTALTVVLS